MLSDMFMELSCFLLDFDEHILINLLLLHLHLLLLLLLSK